MQPDEEKSQLNQELGNGTAEPADAMTPAGASAPQGEADAQAQIADLQEQVLRALAEAENTRRRAEEEVSKARKYAVESFAHSLLPVRDSLEMALSLENQTPEKLREGVEATLRQLANALEGNKVVEVAPPPGTRFDPHRHQAISVVPAADQPVNTVVSVLQKGYVISDRVLRPALVTVAGA